MYFPTHTTLDSSSQHTTNHFIFFLLPFSIFRAGFPKKDDINTPVPKSCFIPGFDDLVKEREALPIPVSEYSRNQMSSTRKLFDEGVPFVLDEDKLAKIHGQNRFNDATDQALAVDSLAAFADQNFLLGHHDYHYW